MTRALLIFLITVSNADMARAENAEWNRLLEESYRYLEARQAEMERDFDISKHQRWDYDQETGQLVFSNGGVPAVVADVQSVGSYSTTSGTWLWAWGNSSILPKQYERLKAVYRFGEENGFAKLTRAKWEAEEVDGWEMAAITTYLLKARGVYRPPYSKGFSFLVITNIGRVPG